VSESTARVLLDASEAEPLTELRPPIQARDCTNDVLKDARPHLHNAHDDILNGLRARLQPLVRAEDRVLPVAGDIGAVLPWAGLKRGSIVAVDSALVLFRLLAEATREGTWVAFVGAPELGLGAAVEQGVELSRVAVVQTPPADQVGAVVAALIDAVGLVVVGSSVAIRSADVRRLHARARERGGVLLVYQQKEVSARITRERGAVSMYQQKEVSTRITRERGAVSMYQQKEVSTRITRERGAASGKAFVRNGWAEGVDLVLNRSAISFRGCSEGSGRVESWSADVVSSGRGAAARTRRVTLLVTDDSIVAHQVSAESEVAIDVVEVVARSGGNDVFVASLAG
jgi:hypothetical protein